MQEMFEEPSSKNRHRTLGEASQRPPRLALHSSSVLERLLLPNALIQQLQPRGLPFHSPRRNLVLHPHRRLHLLNLAHDPISHAAKMPRHGRGCQRRLHGF